MRVRFWILLAACVAASTWTLPRAFAADPDATPSPSEMKPAEPSQMKPADSGEATPADAAKLTPEEMTFESSKLSALNVFSRGDTTNRLGSLDNLIIDAHTGRVLYGILDTGLGAKVLGTGIGGKKIAVPWIAFRLQKNLGRQLLPCVEPAARPVGRSAHFRQQETVADQRSRMAAEGGQVLRCSDGGATNVRYGLPRKIHGTPTRASVIEASLASDFHRKGAAASGRAPCFGS